jgi:hypothetical protein
VELNYRQKKTAHRPKDLFKKGLKYNFQRNQFHNKISYSDKKRGCLFYRIPLGAMMSGRNVKDLETEEQQFPMDYDPLGDAGNPNPSIRDQEYLQHSSLWGHQYMTGGS